MNKYDELMNELLEEDVEAKKEVELLQLKYDLITKLIDYRRNNNLSQKEFAQKINVKQQMISRFEKGNVDPRLSFISKLLYGMNQKIEFTEKDYVMTADIIKMKDFKKKKKRIAEYDFVYLANAK